MNKMKIHTIHFGVGLVLPLKSFDESGFKLLSENLGASGIQISGFDKNQNIWAMKCVQDVDMGYTGNRTFHIRIQRIGNIDSAEKEPLFSFAVLIPENGDYTFLPEALNILTTILIEKFDVSGFVLSKEATVRMIIGPIDDRPSFQFLWENILKQKRDVLDRVGAPFMGGGIRFVSEVKSMEVSEKFERDFKFESLLKDPRYLFAEGIYSSMTPKKYDSTEELLNSFSPLCDLFENNMKSSINALLDEG